MSMLYPGVIQSIARDNYIVHAYCEDGTIREIDMKPLISRGGIFETLRDEHFFRENLTVIGETVAWDVSGDYDPFKCIDIAPETIHEAPCVSETPGSAFD